MNHNPEQQEAIQHTTGPMLLLAGPGSGKTRVITGRIQNLIEQCNILPQRILVITFTKAAAVEMKMRSIQSCSLASQAVFGTFHSVFYHILHQSPRYRDFTLLIKSEQDRLLGNILAMYGVQNEKKASYMEEMGRFMSLCKNFGIPFERLLEDDMGWIWKKAQAGAEGEDEKRLLYKMMLDYRKECHMRQKMDFDDILHYCKELLTEDAAFRAEWRARFSYILVDEFQDVNQVQYDVLRLLSDKSCNLFVVGDDDQAIYGFRGSNPEFMKRFEQDFDGCRILQLSRNYRSCKQIVEAAGRCIRHNQNRFPKEIIAHSTEDGSFEIKSFGQREEEDAWLLSMCRQECGHPAGQQKSVPHSHTAAILVRTNQEAAYYEALLEKAQITCYGAAGKAVKKENKLHRDTVEDILAILQFAKGQRDRSLFFRFMNKPNREISRIAVTQQVSFESLRQTYHQSQQMLQELDKLERNLRFLGNLDAYGAVHYIVSVMGYGNYIKADFPRGRTEQEEAVRTLEFLLEEAEKYDTIQSFVENLARQKDGDMAVRKDGDKEARKDEDRAVRKDQDMVAQTEAGFKTEKAAMRETETEAGIRRGEGDMEKDEAGKEDGNAVRIMTYHAAKGLEFDTVFLPDVRDGVVPHGRMLEKDELEEERRMFYVAMTRAKRNLYISYSGDVQAGHRMSVFIGELQQKDKRAPAGIRSESQR